MIPHGRHAGIPTWLPLHLDDYMRVYIVYDTKVGISVTVSPTLKTFADNLRLNHDNVYHLKLALEAVKQNDEQLFKDIGMPPGQWHDISYIFSNLISSGFDEVY